MMNYMKLAVTLLIVSLMIFYTGCASTNKQKKRPKRPSNATGSFFEDKQDDQEQREGIKTSDLVIEKIESGAYVEDLNKIKIRSGVNLRPDWVNNSWGKSNPDIIFKKEEALFDTIKSQHYIADSLLKVLKVRVAQVIESRVHSEMVSEELVNIKRKGKEEEYNHTSLFKDYSTISSNIILDPSFGYQEVWVDVINWRVHCLYRVNKKKYLQKVQKRKMDNAERAHTNLKDAYSIYSSSAPSVSALFKKISNAAYYINEGGGFVKKPDLVDPTRQNEVIFQKSDLLDKVRKDFEKFRSIDNQNISHQRKLSIPINIPPGEYLDFTSTKLKVSFIDANSKPSMLIDAPRDIYLNVNGDAKLDLELTANVPYESWGKPIHVIIDFNLQSDLIDKESYYESKEYKKLVSNFPSVSFKVTPLKFIRQKTWAIVESPLPNSISISSQDLQEKLSELLDYWDEIFDVIDPDNMDVDYKKAQAYRSGRLMVMPERDSYLNHDLDAVVKVTKNQSEQYHVKVSLHSIDPQRTIKHTELSISHPDSIKSAIDKCLDYFMNEHFNFDISIDTDITTDILKVKVDNRDEDFPEILESGKPNRIPESYLRFQTHDVVIYKKGFKPQKFQTERKVFSLDKPLKQERLVNLHLKNFAKPSGTLKVDIFGSDTGELVRIGKDPYRKNLNHGPQPKIYLQKRWWIFPTGKKQVYRGARLETELTQLGKYAVWARKAAYDPMSKPRREKITLLDDDDLGAIENNYLKIELNPKSPEFARFRSMLFPGLGQWYWAGKGWSMRKISATSFFAATVGSIYFGVTQYRAFWNEKNNYNLLRDEYLSSNDSEQWENYDLLLGASRDRMEEKKRNVYMATGFSGLLWSINVLTVTW